MALAHVQTQYNGGPGVTSVSLTLTLTAGNAVIVTLLSYLADDWTTQTSGDTLTQRLTAPMSGPHGHRTFTNYSVAGGSTTFSFSGSSSYPSIWVSEFSGGLASFDKSVLGSETTGTSISTGTTPTTTTADEVLYVGLNYGATGGIPITGIDNSFTIPTNGDQGNGSYTRGGVAYRIVSATGAYTANWTISASGTCRSIMGTHAMAGGGAGTPTTWLRRSH